jgi:hypothetical protein
LIDRWGNQFRPLLLGEILRRTEKDSKKETPGVMTFSETAESSAGATLASIRNGLCQKWAVDNTRSSGSFAAL